MAECLNMSDQYQPLIGLQDIKELSHLTESAIRDILRAWTGDQGLAISKMGSLEDMSGTNDAFNSSICSLEVSVDYSHPDKSEEESAVEGTKVHRKQQKTFHFVIKTPPHSGFIRNVHKITKPFLNEVTWYSELLGQVALVQEHLPEDFPSQALSLTKGCPTVYHANSNYYSGEAGNTCTCLPWFCWLPIRQAEKGVLVMENVKKRGFTMYDKMRVLPLDHVNQVMTTLAHFHGRWLAYRWLNEAQQLGEAAWSLERFKGALDTQKRVPKPIYKELLKGTHKTVKRILQLEGADDLVPRVHTFYSSTATRQLDMFMGGISTSIDTCVHGDFWGNNIMYRYEAGQVVDSILVDFQLINYGHPAYDLLYLLYISCDKEFRAAHMTSCLERYWDTLEKYILQFKPKIVEYTFSDFQKDLVTYKTVGFVLATTLIPNVLSSNQVEPDGLLALREIQRKQARELEDLEVPSSREIRRRVLGLCQEMAAQGVI